MNVLLALLKPLEAPAQRDELKVAVIVARLWLVQALVGLLTAPGADVGRRQGFNRLLGSYAACSGNSTSPTLFVNRSYNACCCLPHAPLVAPGSYSRGGLFSNSRDTATMVWGRNGIRCAAELKAALWSRPLYLAPAAPERAPVC